MDVLKLIRSVLLCRIFSTAAPTAECGCLDLEGWNNDERNPFSCSD